MKDKKWCVYKHTSPSGKVYIGITCQNPKYRWANGNGYKGQGFYYAIQKYGWENFKHEILEDNLTEEEAHEKERLYIKLYNSRNKNYGYNRTDGGENALSGSDNFRARKILQCDLDGRIIKKWNCITDAADSIGLAKTTINNCLSKEKASAGGYMWFYLEDKDEIRPYVFWENPNKRPIVQFSLNGEYIKEWNSISEAESYYKNKGIASCLRNNCWTSNNFLWFYKDEIENTNIQKYIKNTKYKNFHVKKVFQCSMSGEIINEWGSISEASNHLKISLSGISQAARGVRKSRMANGYLWFYDKEDIHPYVKKINTRKIEINQYDLNGKLIKTWHSLTEASIFIHGTTGGLAKCCKRQIQIYKGFQWRYKDDCSDISKYCFVGTSKKVNKYDENGNYIETYNSCSIASKENNINMSSISGCCNKHHKTAGGFIWRYADEVENNTLGMVI